MATFARAIRRLQIEALDSILEACRIDRHVFPPALVAAAVQGLAPGGAHDQVAGFETAHEEASAATTDLVDQLEKREQDGGRRDGLRFRCYGMLAQEPASH